MQIIPAIDIKNGKIVRLYQGDYKKATIYKDNPVDVAMEWKNRGAKIIHIVDLDGAKEGKPKIMRIIKQIVEKTKLPIQVGGGIRNVQSIKRLYTLGVNTIVIGTIALENIKLLKKIIDLYKKKIIISIDVNKNNIMKRGWLKKTNLALIPIIRQLEIIGVSSIIYTDITRDGTLTEPNYSIITLMRKSTKMNLIIAGGVSSIDQIKKLKAIGVDGIIIGKALYENKINLKEAIKYVS